MRSVDRDLATADELRARNRDWALAIAYNALLQGCVALMAAHGYRARGEAQHRTIVEFARLVLPEQENRLARVTDSASGGIERSTTSRVRSPQPK